MALAGALSDVEGGHHRERQIDRAHVVRHGDAGGQRVAVRLAGDANQAALSLRRQIERRVAGPRPLRSPARCVAVDDACVRLADLLVAQPQPLHHAGAEVVDHHVAVFRQPKADALRLLRLQVERDATLPAVMGEKVGAEPVLARRTDDPAQIAEDGRLDLDHVGAHIGEGQRGLRTLLEDREVQYSYAFERLHGGSFPRGAPPAYRPAQPRHKGWRRAFRGYGRPVASKQAIQQKE